MSSITPEKYGGEGLDNVSYGVLLEELARCWPSMAVSMMVQSGQARFIAQHGTDDQRQAYLPGLLSADLIASLGGTEPNAGSALRELQSTA
ncbi:MAG: acyl-CoA dehydrogenase, partial [Planctomycetes bacterium]|nr:acyl-CoA dehydrogenase [Planctomycetota bacterium]